VKIWGVPVVDSGVETKNRAAAWAVRPSPPTWRLPEGFRLATFTTNGHVALPEVGWPQDGIIAARLNGPWVDVWHPDFECSVSARGIHYVNWLRVAEQNVYRVGERVQCKMTGWTGEVLSHEDPNGDRPEGYHLVQFFGQNGAHGRYTYQLEKG
jgi:hypothetical protein